MKKLTRKWLKTYYPKPASEMIDKSDLKVVKHSLLKWQGLTDLENYDLVLKNGNVLEKDPNNEDQIILAVDADSCSLCMKYYKDSCDSCPLYKMRFDRSCDESENLYQQSLKKPQLMVDVLTKLLNWIREK